MLDSNAVIFSYHNFFILQDGVKETDSCKSWSKISTCKAKVEKDLKGRKNLNWIVVRPAMVYGVGDRKGLGKFL